MIGMAWEEEFEHKMFAIIDWIGLELAKHLSQLKLIGADAESEEASRAGATE